MNRRGFLSAIVGCVLWPFVPVPVWAPKRAIYATIRITPEMIAAQGAWNRARQLEMDALIQSIQVPMWVTYPSKSFRLSSEG